MLKRGNPFLKKLFKKDRKFLALSLLSPLTSLTLYFLERSGVLEVGSHPLTLSLLSRSHLSVAVYSNSHFSPSHLSLLKKRAGSRLLRPGIR
jgi:hypothetical protein